MMNLKFCPKCGNETLLWDGEKKWSCSTCDYVLYNNVAAAVAVIIKCGDEIFFTRRNQEPKKGLLDLTGGFTDPNESGEETCARELYEELKIKIDKQKLRYLASLSNDYHYKGIDYKTLDLFYEYEISEKFDPELELSEISEGIWIKKSELTLDELAFESQKRFFQFFKKQIC